MPRIRENPDGTISLEWTPEQWAFLSAAACIPFYCACRVEDTGSGNQSLAQGIAPVSNSQGLASKAGKQARKGAGKK